MQAKTTGANKNVGRDIDAARDVILNGGVVAYPTEGVFGLGCDPNNETAINNLLALKKRSIERGFILIAAQHSQLQPFIGNLSADIEHKLSETWPGPVTWILPCSANASAAVTGGKPTIATRVTDHPTASALCTACNSAIISTSANISGETACTQATGVASVFGDKLDYILDYPVGNLDGPTPIFDGLTGKQLR